MVLPDGTRIEQTAGPEALATQRDAAIARVLASHDLRSRAADMSAVREGREGFRELYHAASARVRQLEARLDALPAGAATTAHDIQRLTDERDEARESALQLAKKVRKLKKARDSAFNQMLAVGVGMIDQRHAQAAVAALAPKVVAAKVVELLGDLESACAWVGAVAAELEAMGDGDEVE